MVTDFLTVQILFAPESIFYVKGLLPTELCQSIITTYEGDPRRQPGCVLRGRGEKQLQDEIKVSMDLPITHAHCGKIPRSEHKYIVSSFVSFAIPTASPDKEPEL